MKEEIVAFQDLAQQLNLTVGAVKIFSDELLKFNRKRTLRNFKIEKKISDLEIEIVESYFDDGSMCGGCWKNPDTCEGSHCTERTEIFFEEVSKDQAARKAFEIFGDRYYSFSMRIKNQLKR